MKKVSDLKENIDPEKIKDPLPNAKMLGRNFNLSALTQEEIPEEGG